MAPRLQARAAPPPRLSAELRVESVFASLSLCAWLPDGTSISSLPLTNSASIERYYTL
jgi:hypothetical protein